MSGRQQLVKEQLAESAQVKEDMISSCSDEILKAAEIFISALTNGKKIMWCGNGGSAADCQHLSTEMLARLRKERRPLASIALTTDTSLLTAWSNDYSFDSVFVRQVEGLGRKGDVLVAISTSGNSRNVIEVVNFSENRDIKVVILTGKDGGKLKEHGDVMIKIPSRDTQHIQEGHITAGHIICDLVEQAFL
ncbi:MAG: SIS domain-containing protein [Candidatus Marinimicrobia bacterium]|nr:SIS domain-containing protein [Candidatus Neomarinimicrobiota bacterium]MBL7046957.1 SIS domain-containing protein [Candidatus Neomarinimicrobiota bacterium]